MDLGEPRVVSRFCDTTNARLDRFLIKPAHHPAKQWLYLPFQGILEAHAHPREFMDAHQFEGRT